MLSSWQIQSSIFNHNSCISRWTDLSCFLWSFFKYVILFLRQVWTTFIIQNHPAILKVLKNNVYSLPCFPISFKQGFIHLHYHICIYGLLPLRYVLSYIWFTVIYWLQSGVSSSVGFCLWSGCQSMRCYCLLNLLIVSDIIESWFH